jgi:spoIIIJ-associated protein
MNSYERRIIHTALSDYPGIVTFSEGEDPYRHVIIAIEGEEDEANEESYEDEPEKD